MVEISPMVWIDKLDTTTSVNMVFNSHSQFSKTMYINNIKWKQI